MDNPIVGWSMEDVASGLPVSVRTIHEGTMDVAIDRANSGTIFPGRYLCISHSDPAKMKTMGGYESATVVTSSVDGTEVTLNVSGEDWTVDEHIGKTLWVSSGEYDDQSFKVTDNAANSVTIEVGTSTSDWDAGVTFYIGDIPMGMALEYWDDSDNDKLFMQALIVRQYSLSERQ